MTDANTSTPFSPDPDDPFFSLERGGQWNACIGIQGSAENYVDGYMEAALELAGAVIDKRNFASRDTLAMPILYNARHGLELALKFAVDRLHACGAVAQGAQMNHDIKLHWDAIDAAAVGDAEIRRLVAALKPYVESLHAVDEGGQQLRYATHDGEQSLASKAICDLELVRESLTAMSALLNDLKYRVLSFADERHTGTHTRDCSRRDLQQIAAWLPLHAEWVTPAFVEAKKRVMEAYALGSGKFSDALDKIKAHRQMGGALGFEFNLVHLTDEHARFVIRTWAPAHLARPTSALGIVRASEISAADVVEQVRLVETAVDTVAAALPLEAAAELEACYYLGALGGHCEAHDGRVADLITRYQREGALREQIRHIIMKGNLGEALASAVECLGRPRLGAELRAILAEGAVT